MLRRLLPLGPVLLVALADGAGAHRLAFYLLLLAVPAAVAASLTCFGEALEGGPEEGLQALLAALALILVVAGAAARAPYVTQGALPTSAVSALVAVLVLLGIQFLAGLPALVTGRRVPESA
ncbi:MAG: hypothetical protein ACXVZ2_11280 [Gaiellaceae bacterium]